LIKAEIIKLNFYKQSGHCYPDLVEKKDGKIIAQIRCNLWKDDYIKINSTFQRVLNEPLKDGIKILLLASIGFHPEHGLALRIIDIDPSFTLGDLEREKQDTIKKLTDEGVFKQNKSLRLAVLPQRIAIISVQTSKGYADFLKVFESANTSWGYKFFHMLFPTLLQGDKAVESISNQLKRIKKVKKHFDVVAIVRGGGGDIGLSCYDNYNLAKSIATFPIPVITGIGHATNQTVVEMIAYENAITPTKLAEFLIQKFHNFSVPVQKAKEKIIDKSKQLLNEEKAKFQSEVKLFRSVAKNIIIENKNSIRENAQSLSQQSRFLFRSQKDYLISIGKQIKSGSKELCNSAKQDLMRFVTDIRKDVLNTFKQQKLTVDQKGEKILIGTRAILKDQNFELNSIEKNVNNMSPGNVLKRGYSITLFNGKVIKSLTQVKEGDELKSEIFEGSILSIVKSTNKQS
jgi:exodeoxyribonuclease VII large subunit